MIKIIFMAKETPSSKKALDYLCVNNNLIKIVAAVIRSSDVGLREKCERNGIAIYTEKDLMISFNKGMISADYIFSFYWKRVSAELLAIPRKGSINFHPGPLPEARGSGYHMAILENWRYWGVTAHYMDEEFDTGAIIECRQFDIPEDIVNKDLVTMTHENLSILFNDIVDKILNGEKLVGKEQDMGRYFSLHNLEESKLIQEHESIEAINRKIRAFWNPPYSGAQVEIKGKKYTVINEDILKWISERLDLQ